MKKGLISTASIIIGGAVTYGLTVHAAPAQPTVTQAPTPPQQLQPAAKQASDAYGGMAAPKRLIIASLSINSQVSPVGLTKDGSMDIPDSLEETGWYNQSAHPGNPGRAVMAAHTGYPSKPSKFRQLENIKPGTTLQIQDQAGKTATFSVIETKTYPANATPTHIIFGDSPTARLNLITCTGKWDAAKNSYTDRLVIFTARVE